MNSYCGCPLITHEKMPKDKIVFIDGVGEPHHLNVPMTFNELTGHDKKEILVFQDFLRHVGSPGNYKNLPEPWKGYCDGTWSAQDMCWRDLLGFEGDDA